MLMNRQLLARDCNKDIQMVDIDPGSGSLNFSSENSDVSCIHSPMLMCSKVSVNTYCLFSMNKLETKFALN